MSESETIQGEIVEPKRKGRPKGSKTNKQTLNNSKTRQILSLRAQGVPNQAIAATVNLHKRTVERAIKKFEPLFQELKNVEDYRASKDRLIEAAELMTLKSMVDPEKHAKASLNNVAYAFTQLHQAGRLERGLSTSNQAVSQKFTVVSAKEIED